MDRQRLVTALTWTSGVLAVLLVVLLAFAGYLWNLSTKLPDLAADPDAIEMAQTSVVYASDGSVLAEWYDAEDRTIVPTGSIPQSLRDAVVAIEDHRFYEHSGVDLQAIARALSVNTSAGEVRQGGSTITQQTVKLLFTDGKRTLRRKIEEALLALQLESMADKEAVLGVYLNMVYYGHGAYGVQSAAQRFFGVDAADLTLAQSALLAGCIQSPTRYDPFVHPSEALERRNLVLRVMRDQHLVDEQEAAGAIAEPLGLREQNATAQRVAPYFVEYVRRELLEELGSERLYRGGLRIHTTLDPTAQRAAEAAASAVLPSPDDPEVAIASVRWRDGSVVAVVGGRDFAAEQFDLATQGRRQTGSAFKPFVLAAALEDGYTLDSMWEATPFTTPVKDGVWHVENYENAITGGQYSLQTATTWSINTVYARLIMAVGPGKVVDVAHRMGISSEINDDPAIALGGLTTGVSPLEMASAFGTIANDGVAIAPTGIDRVTDSAGQTVYEPDRTGTEAISVQVATALEGALNQVFTYGTGTSANFGQWGAVKTGTAQSWRDAWLVGYSGELSTAVWVGYPKAQVAMEDVHGIRVTGGSFPAQIWKTYMQVASAGTSAQPSSVAPSPSAGSGEQWVTYTLCAESMKVAGPRCPETMELAFPAGALSDEVCTLKH
ncbi:MAG: penicillin-binding protein [Coriobacteriia bacterium]|nr:penicillin-binding protein [Coriobacteriia bacterium]MBN2848540.1 penicillin-binding protein [Coriobacteriia bacterium]